MRKLVAAELAVFALTLAASQGTSADEPTTLSTVTVNASYTSLTTSYNFGWWTPSTFYGQLPAQLGLYPGSQQAINYHALTCAKAYMPRVGGISGQSGPRPGYYTFIISNYGWKDPATGTRYQTFTSTPPVANATMLGGTTYYGQPGESFIFLPGAGGSTGYLIQNIAHEWAHQWGATDNSSVASMNAYTIGKQAMDAWKNDGGAKCGGL